jgi:hypothetical protein
MTTLDRSTVVGVVDEALMGAGWMVGLREEDGALVARERGDYDGGWVSVVVRVGAPHETKRVDLIRGVLGLHTLTCEPSCTCGNCPASMFVCTCGVQQPTREEWREHVAEHIVAVLDE